MDTRLDTPPFSGRRHPKSRIAPLNTKARFVPTGATERDKAPDLRAYAGSNGIVFGAAWTKSTKDGARVYHSVKLDDPSFPNPIYASLVETADANTFSLVWSR